MMIAPGCTFVPNAITGCKNNEIAYFPFDSDTSDYYGHTVTGYGGISVSGGELVLDGGDDYLSITTGLDFVIGADDFTIKGYFACSTQSNNGRLVYIGDSTTRVEIGIFAGVYDGVTTKGCLFCQVGTSAGTNYTTNYTDNVQRHFAITRESGVVTVYIDGAQVGSISNDTTNIPGDYFYIGNDHVGTRYFGGTLDEISIILGCVETPGNWGF